MPTLNVINRPSRHAFIYHALALSPFTARQLLKLSSATPTPFTSLRRVQETLKTLTRRRRINCHRYSSDGPGGGFHYYTLTPATYRDFFGNQAPLLPRSMFRKLSDRRQRHTFLLAEITVHLIVCAKRAGVRIENVYPENACRLQLDAESIFPDRAFDLVSPSGKRYRFFGELDNNTKSIFSIAHTDCMDDTIRKYLAFARSTQSVFRVPIWTTGGPERVQHILDAVSAAIDDPNRSLVYAVNVEEFLNCPTAVTSPCWRDHRGRSVALVRQATTPPVQQPRPELVACQR